MYILWSVNDWCMWSVILSYLHLKIQVACTRHLTLSHPIHHRTLFPTFYSCTLPLFLLGSGFLRSVSHHHQHNGADLPAFWDTITKHIRSKSLTVPCVLTTIAKYSAQIAAITISPVGVFMAIYYPPAIYLTGVSLYLDTSNSCKSHYYTIFLCISACARLLVFLF